MRRVVAGLAELFLLGAAVLGIGGAAGAGETALPDPENPRNARFTPPWIGYLAVGEIEGEARDSGPPRLQVRGAKEIAWRAVRGGPDDAARARGLVRPEFLGDEVSWTLDGRPLATLHETKQFKLSNGGAAEALMGSFVRAPAPPERHRLEARIMGDVCHVETNAIRVLVLVEKDTLAAGDERFGSLVRRFRKSLDDLNALLEASAHPMAPSGVLDRFRIQQFLELDRYGLTKSLSSVPRRGFDVLVMCDQHGIGPGADLAPSRIEFSFEGKAPHRGLWSSWGEQTLWRELLRLRGVQILARSRAAPGALPGRWKGELPLPSRYAVDLMASPFQTPVITEYTAVMLNARYGVADVGDCEDTANVKLGHVWNWLPGRVALYLTRAGAPASGSAVRWWRSLPMKGLPADAPQGIEEGRAPDGEATTDAAGLVGITGDYLGRTQPKESRSLWMLVEVDTAGKRKFEILYGLDLHLAYARGDKYRATVRWELDHLLEPGGSLPVDR